MKITGQYVDILNKKIFPATISIEQGKINSILPLSPSEKEHLHYILPGFIDAHIHIESSMLVPSEFARLAVVHGTVATVSDPHEIANVCGLKGVEFMINNGKKVPFKFYFGAPSCVPATAFETAGAELDSEDVEKLLQRKEIRYLSEMMNFPGVLNGDNEVMKKIKSAKKNYKLVDGHAPGLRGDDAKKYIAAGISTDHECFTFGEAKEKLELGMKILIREGSAAKNFEALIDLLHDHPNEMMFCSDDKHPDSLVAGHINQLCQRAVAKDIDVFNVLQAACVNPVLHYSLDVGLLRQGDAADFIIVKDLVNFEVLQTFINGDCVAENGKSFIERQPCDPINNFSVSKKTAADFNYPLNKWGEDENIEQVYVIEALEGQLITNKSVVPVTDLIVEDGYLQANPEKDLLKIVVVNRYADTAIAKSFVKNFDIKNGAIASSVAHDSHNIIAVGTNDESICNAINMIIENKGGISFTTENTELVIPLPVAGLMSSDDGYKIADQYINIDKAVKEAGCTLASPFMTLSFMALLVIPHLKLSDKGLFDCDKFEFA